MRPSRVRQLEVRGRIPVPVPCTFLARTRRACIHRNEALTRGTDEAAQQKHEPLGRAAEVVEKVAKCREYR